MKPGSFRQLLHPKYFQAFNGNCHYVGVRDSMVASLDAELVQRPKVNQLQRVSLTRSSFPNRSHCLEKQGTHSEAIDDICQT